MAHVLTTPGPRFQALAVGDRVTPIRRRKRGTVASILGARPADGMSTVVTVRWDGAPKWTETWATDCLVVVESGGDMSSEGRDAA